MRTVKWPKLSARLKELRKEKHLKQVEMAEILECTKTHYQQIEYGHINIPSLTLETLADFFNGSTDYVLGRSDDRRTL